MSNYIYRKPKFKKMFFFTTPTKKENESTTPKTEINESPYDYQKQLDFEFG